MVLLFLSIETSDRINSLELEEAFVVVYEKRYDTIPAEALRMISHSRIEYMKEDTIIHIESSNYSFDTITWWR